MAYQFRFESVLGYRRNLEEIAKQELLSQQSELALQESRLLEMEVELKLAISQLEEKKQKPISTSFFVMLMEGIQRREDGIRAQKKAIVAQEGLVEQAREKLMSKVRERKVMEQLRENDHKRFMVEELQKEQNEIDEQMVLRYEK